MGKNTVSTWPRLRYKVFQLFLIGLILKNSLTIIFKYIYAYVLRDGSSTRSISGRRKQDCWDYVCISHFPWTKWWGRSQHTAWRFADKSKVIYCTPLVPFHIFNRTALGTGVSTDFWNKPRHKMLRPNLLIFNCPLFPGEGALPKVQKVNAILLKVWLKYYMRLLGIDRPYVLWFYYPAQNDLARMLDEDLTVYDIQDEYASIPWTAGIESREVELLRKADLVFTGTFALKEKKKVHASNIHFFSCGVDFKHFHKSAEGGLIFPKDLKGIPRPILGYFGSIDIRLDGPLIQYLTSSRPGWSFVFLGPVHGWENLKPYFSSPNLFLLGTKEYGELPNYLQAFDVCLLPFDLRNEVSLHINPTKTLEYLAGAKPVVSTAIPDVVRFFDGVVQIAHTREEFLMHCDRMITRPPGEIIEKGLEMALNTSWDRIIEGMEYIIGENLKRKYRDGHDKGVLTVGNI